MAIPLNARRWDEQMDPADVLEWVLHVGIFNGQAGLLEPLETVASYTLALSAEAVALGLTTGTLTRAASQPTPTSFRWWFLIDSAFQSNAAFSGEGALLPMELTIVTDATPSRTLQRTLVLKVAQQ